LQVHNAVEVEGYSGVPVEDVMATSPTVPVLIQPCTRRALCPLRRRRKLRD
jgi:hypothetical protein